MEKIKLTGRIPSHVNLPNGTAVSRRKEGNRPDNKQKKESPFRRPKKVVQSKNKSEGTERKKGSLPKRRGNSVDIEA